MIVQKYVNNFMDEPEDVFDEICEDVQMAQYFFRTNIRAMTVELSDGTVILYKKVD